MPTEPQILTLEQIAEIEEHARKAPNGAEGWRIPALCQTVRVLRWQLDLAEKAFELEGAVKLSEVGNLNILQVVRKITELQSRLSEVEKERDELRQRERKQLSTVIQIRACDKCDLCEDHA